MSEMKVNPTDIKEGLLKLAEAFHKLSDAVVITENAPVQVPMQQPVLPPQQMPQYAAPNFAQPQAVPVQQNFATSQPTVPMQMPVSQAAVPTATAPTAGPVPTTAVAQEYTQDQLAVACAGLVNQGKQGKLMQILQGFGVTALVEVPKERYGELATVLRAEGAVI